MTQTSIPILDLGPDVDAHFDGYRDAFERVLRSGQYIGGPEVRAFEAEVAEYLGTTYAIGLNSGTDALVIALRALNIGPGDEVVTTPFTFFATAEAISMVGATPVFADVDERTYNLDPDAVEAALTERTRAILPVHLYGQPARMSRIVEIAERHRIAVVEDCAQSFGAQYHGECVGCEGTHCDTAVREQLCGQMTGTIGKIGTFSFFPSKNLGAFGDAGMVVTDDSAVAELAVKLRAHGGKHKYHNEMLGYNSRLDSLQAALLREKLPRIDATNKARRKVARRYSEAFSNIPGVVVPEVNNGHVFHQYTIRVLDGRRDVVEDALTQAGIQTMVYYPVPVHRLPVYAEAGFPSMPVTERLAGEVLSLPVGPNLSERDQRTVIDSVTDALKPSRSYR